MQQSNSHAVVIGGSMAGLLAARVLSNHFSKVTILERDRYPFQPEPRAGVPQAHHVHALLLRGFHILERLFPGIREEFVANGGILLDIGQDFVWLTPAGWAPRFSSGLRFLSVSRPMIDWVVRGRVRALTNVEFRESAFVRGLSIDEQRSAVNGVNISCAGAPGGRLTIPADFVMDAAGRGSRAPEWLASFGIARPREDVVNGHLGYASRIYRRTPESQSEWKATFSQAAPPRVCRTGLAFPLEGDRWMVTLAGGARDYPPTDEQGFAEFARSLPNPGVYRVIRTSEPLTPIHGNRGTDNRLRHWESVQMPAGFAVLGDAACAFNPVYGQGMTTAAIGAELLDHCLARGRMGSFQKRLTAALGFPWTMATSEDVRYPGAEGADAGLGTRFMHWYLDRVIALSVRHIPARRDMLRIFHMLSGPQLMFRPGILFRVLDAALRGSGDPRKNQRAPHGLPIEA